ncbi:hypothetical protein, partial [Streptomyces katrae]|uniref:hypothetical protein n=1 Tax=Streptomyces katrae TaxID=68223 RepID=UPI001B80B45A
GPFFLRPWPERRWSARKHPSRKDHCIEVMRTAFQGPLGAVAVTVPQDLDGFPVFILFFRFYEGVLVR